MAKGQRFYVRSRDGRFADDPNKKGLPATGKIGVPLYGADTAEYQLAASDVDAISDKLYAAARNEHIKEGDFYWQTPEGDISEQTFHRIFRGSQHQQDRYVAWINGTDEDREELADNWGDPRYAADKVEEIDMRGHVNNIEHVDFWNDDIAKRQAKNKQLTRGPKDDAISKSFRDYMRDRNETFDDYHACLALKNHKRTKRELAWALRRYPQYVDAIATTRNGRKLSKRDSDWALNNLYYPENSRNLAIANLNLSDDMKDRLLNSDNAADRNALTSRNDLTLEQKQRMFVDPDPGVRADSVRWMPREEFEEASYDPAPEVRQQVAFSDFANRPILRRLAKDPSPDVRLGVAINDVTDPETLDALTKDEDFKVSKNALENDNTRYDTLKEFQRTHPADDPRQQSVAIALLAHDNHEYYTTAFMRPRSEWAKYLPER